MSLWDERGIAMPLAIMVMVIVGVMGAGLLVFVSNDLSAVVEENRSEKALAAAEAGAEMGREELLKDSSPELYDVDDPSDEDVYIDGACNSAGEESVSEWSVERGGESVLFSDGDARVTIRWLPAEAETPAECASPEAGSEEAEEGRAFRVISEGTYRGARRIVEATYRTADAGIPRAYYSDSSVTLNGNACIEDVSVFSTGDLNFGGGNCQDVDGERNIIGVDKAYGDWQNDRNPTARETARAGAGVLGNITGGTDGRDYEGPEMVDRVAEGQEGQEIGFPFDPDHQREKTDEMALALWEDIAREQGNYEEVSGSVDLRDWPENATENTVVYYRFTGGNNRKLSWKVGNDCDDKRPGILVVENADFQVSGNKDMFSGAVIVRGGEVEDGDYSDSGNTCMEGFVNADGEITISGAANPEGAPDLSTSPGFYTVERLYWRELYG